MDFNFQQQKVKYLNDVQYNRLVDTFYNLLINHEFTRYELQDALDFAIKKFAMDYPELMIERNTKKYE